MATVLTIGTAISEAKQLPADGRCYCLPCGLEAIHFPANKMHAETGLTPRELAEQVQELRKLKGLV